MCQDPPCPLDSLNILRSCAPNPVKDWVASQTPWLNWGGLNGWNENEWMDGWMNEWMVDFALLCFALLKGQTRDKIRLCRNCARNSTHLIPLKTTDSTNFAQIHFHIFTSRSQAISWHLSSTTVLWYESLKPPFVCLTGCLSRLGLVQNLCPRHRVSFGQSLFLDREEAWYYGSQNNLDSCDSLKERFPTSTENMVLC